MKSVFGSKRKARKIQVDDDDEAGANDAGISTGPVKSRKYHEALTLNLADLRSWLTRC